MCGSSLLSLLLFNVICVAKTGVINIAKNMKKGSFPLVNVYMYMLTLVLAWKQKKNYE